MPFEWISNEPVYNEKYISIDREKRFFISAEAARLLGIKSFPEPVYIAYDHANKQIAVARVDNVKLDGVRPYRFSDRRYSSARPFLRKTDISESELPQRYIYVGRDDSIDVPGGAFVFELED